MSALLGYAFTAAPIGFLVWNCLAVALSEWLDVASVTSMFHAYAAVQTGAETSPPSSRALGPTLGVGAPLLAYAGIAVLFHITSDLIEAIKTHFFANPPTP